MEDGAAGAEHATAGARDGEEDAAGAPVSKALAKLQEQIIALDKEVGGGGRKGRGQRKVCGKIRGEEGWEGAVGVWCAVLVWRGRVEVMASLGGAVRLQATASALARIGS